MIPVGKTLSKGLVEDGLLNTAPHMLVEAFGLQNLTVSVLMVLSQYLCARQKEELPVAGGADVHRTIILVEITIRVIHIADSQLATLPLQERTTRKKSPPEPTT